MKARLEDGTEIQIDRQDLPLLGRHGWRWCITDTGRGNVCYTLHNKVHYLHRRIMGVRAHCWVKFKNDDRKDFRRRNLYVVRHRTKEETVIAHRSYKGVFRVGDRWEARIRERYGARSLGIFESEVEAAHAYDKAARLKGYGSERLNFPRLAEEEGS